MLYLYNSFGSKGDREQWCLVKHLSMAMYTAFEAYQASDRDPELLNIALEINKKFIETCTKFLGVEITSCASCFADIMKAGGNNMQPVVCNKDMAVSFPLKMVIANFG